VGLNALNETSHSPAQKGAEASCRVASREPLVCMHGDALIATITVV